jgi:hypothetical protein
MLILRKSKLHFYSSWYRHSLWADVQWTGWVRGQKNIKEKLLCFLYAAAVYLSVGSDPSLQEIWNSFMLLDRAMALKVASFSTLRLGFVSGSFYVRCVWKKWQRNKSFSLCFGFLPILFYQCSMYIDSSIWTSSFNSALKDKLKVLN